MAKFLVFDLADKQLPFESRMEKLREISVPSFVEIVEHTKCLSRDHFFNFFAEVRRKNGEGVVLREPGSSYEKGRSQSLKKYKVRSHPGCYP